MAQVNQQGHTLPIETPRYAVGRVGEIAMFAITEFSRSTQRVACMLMAAFIVVAGLAAGAHGVNSLAHPGYTVTITEMR